MLATDFHQQERRPVLAYEVVVNLYPVGADGQVRRDLPVWLGGCIEQMRAMVRFETRRLPTSGKRGLVPIQVSELHTLDFERVWLARLDTLGDFRPQLGGEYACELIWQDPDSLAWFRFTYTGVVFENADWSSQRLFAHTLRQQLTAAGCTDEAGIGVIPSTESPDGLAATIGYFHDGALVTDTNERDFLGHIAFAVDLILDSAQISYVAGAGSATVTLLLDGVAQSGSAFTVAAGSGEQAVTLTIGRTIPAGTEVRWRVTATSGTVDTLPTSAVIVAQFTGVATELPLEFIQNDALVAGSGTEEWLGSPFVLETDGTLTHLRLIARPGSTNTVLTLQVDGVDTAVTVTLPGYGGGTDAAVTVNLTGLALALTTGQTLRWHATSGPSDVLLCPWQMALTAYLQL